RVSSIDLGQMLLHELKAVPDDVGRDVGTRSSPTGTVDTCNALLPSRNCPTNKSCAVLRRCLPQWEWVAALQGRFASGGRFIRGSSRRADEQQYVKKKPDFERAHAVRPSKPQASGFRRQFQSVMAIAVASNAA